jgi:malate dehydrogenase (quinone)
VPFINKRLFVKDARKIVPSLAVEDIEYAKGFGGIRPQVLDKALEQLLLGEASINPECGIIFNMTPSPGATSCLGNAERDMREIVKHLDLKFDEERFLKDLTE